MRLKIVLSIIGMMIGLTSHSQINLAGVYEGEMNDNITRKRMYANLDFINEVPDFTQIFTTKESPMKILPKDFMNAKKLKKNFAGQKAPGFIRYNSKTIFSSTEEIKLVNPRLEDGVLTADWVNNEGRKGQCFIIVNPDNTIQILGLTTLDKDLGPDNLILNRVENKLPEGVEPFVTDPSRLPLTNKRYCREILWKLKLDSSKGLSGVEASIDPAQVRRIGNNILVPVLFRNHDKNEARPYFGDYSQFERNEFASIDGNPYWVKGVDDIEKSIGGNETALIRFEIVGVPLNAQKVDHVKFGGRAQYTHSTESNPYGGFEYKFSDLVLPDLQPSNKDGVYITDSDLMVLVEGVATEGKDLVVNLILLNRSDRDKALTVSSKGIARDRSGEEYECTAIVPASLDKQERGRVKLTIVDAGSTNIVVAKVPITVKERNLDFQATLYLN